MMYPRRLDAEELAKLLTPDQLKEQLAIDALQDSINDSYPHGHLVAIHDGRIIANAPDFDKLAAILKAAGLDTKNCVVIQAGRRIFNHVFMHSLTKT